MAEAGVLLQSELMVLQRLRGLQNEEGDLEVPARGRFWSKCAAVRFSVLQLRYAHRLFFVC